MTDFLETDAGNEDFTWPGRFDGQVLVISGAVGGIGSAIAARAAREGATIVATDRRQDGLQLAEELLGPTRAEWIYVNADLSVEEEARSVIETAVSTYGHLDVLVNNAGGGIIADFLAHTPETRRETVDRNLWTVVNCCEAALPAMQAAGYGRIVNLGADSVRNGLYQHAMYNAAKGGVHALTTGLAREFAGDGITVNTVAPTGTVTPYTRSRPADAVERFEKNRRLIPMNRFASAKEVASVTLFVASREASFLTGQVISVNGGSTML